MLALLKDVTFVALKASGETEERNTDQRPRQRLLGKYRQDPKKAVLCSTAFSF